MGTEVNPAGGGFVFGRVESHLQTFLSYHLPVPACRARDARLNSLSTNTEEKYTESYKIVLIVVFY